MALDDDFKPARKVVVKVTDAATSADAGQGVTDKIGEYKTSKPYGKGLVSYKIEAQSGSPFPSVTETFVSRHRHRVSFSGVMAPLTCCDLIFCSDDFYFPFVHQAGDHDRLPLDDWRQVGEPEEKE